MIRKGFLVVSLLFAFTSLGCTDEACIAGECIEGEECVDICVESCDGAVISAFCNGDEFCECECEFACF